MKIMQLPLERFDEMDSLYDMTSVEGFREKRLENLKNCREICLVAEEKGEIIGEISIMTENINIPAAVIPNKRVYLFGLRVKEQFRRNGVGRQLLVNAISLCMKRGIFQFTIGVEKENSIARRFYESCGFYPLLENCVEMQQGRRCVYDLLYLDTREKTV